MNKLIIIIIIIAANELLQKSIRRGLPQRSMHTLCILYMTLIYSLSHLSQFVENHPYFKWPECLSGF